MVVAPFLLEQLSKMVLAVENAVKGGVGRSRELAAAVRALEAGLVV